jgi:hypothetical protein
MDRAEVVREDEGKWRGVYSSDTHVRRTRAAQWLGHPVTQLWLAETTTGDLVGRDGIG